MSELKIEPVLARLTAILRKNAVPVWESMRPAVADADLEALARVIHPYEIPPDLEALLRWADGQADGAHWWPSMECGPLLSARRAAEHYSWLRENVEDWQWSAAWLPIAHEGWCQAAIELAPDGPGVIIDASWPDPAWLLAPTLAAMLEITAEMVEAGITVEAFVDARDWRATRNQLSDARPEWEICPYPRVVSTNTADWPAHWR